MSLGFCLRLVSVIMSSCGDDMSVVTVAATKCTPGLISAAVDIIDGIKLKMLYGDSI